MRVGFVSQWFDPERGSAAQASNIARSLVRQGLEVTVLTGYPNYPDGEIYPGYRVRAHQLEKRDGMDVHRVPLVPTHRPNAASRFANYLSFAASASVAAPLVLAKSDATLVHLTPSTTAAAAMTLRATQGVPYVLHVQDLWPDTVLASGFLQQRGASAVEKALHAFCDRAYAGAHAIAVTSPGMADRIVRRGVDSAKLHVAPNWADENAFHPLPVNSARREELGLRPFTVMYAGNLGEFQALDTLLDVAAMTRELSDVGYVIVGGGTREASLRARVEQEALDNVTFLPAQPFHEMSAILALGDLHYVGLEDLPLFRLTLPSKLQATMAVGRPILGALRGDAAAVIRASGAGRCHDPGDVQGLAASVRDFSARPGQAQAAGRLARAYYEQHFSESASSGVLAELLRSAHEQRGNR